MKKFKKFLVITLVASLAFVGFGLLWSSAALAATSPDLLTAATYSILAGSSVTNSGATTISGNVGIYPGAAVPPNVTGWGTVTLGGALHDTDVSAQQAQADQKAVFDGPGPLVTPACDTTYIGAFKELAGVTLAPGIYCATSFHLTTGVLTLNGSASDVWIFRSASDLIITGGAAAKVAFTGGGLPCNVWWRVVSTATFDDGSSLAGSILAATSVTFGTGASLDGRAFAYTGLVSLLGNTISGPTCTAVVPPSQGSHVGNINVVKVVINDNGGTKTVADFPLFVNGLPVVSGVTNVFPAPAAAYTVTETANPNYTRTFSGDCDINGQLNLSPGYNRFCIITNNDIGTVVVPPVPPLIDVVKVPSPLALPNGPGLVQYTYTLRNIGTVPVTNVTMVDDTCSPAALISGDTNGDAKLDVNETWIYTCSTTLAATHTNTVVATGWANGISAIDIANATVVVGVPVVPPLIHVTKIPSPLTLPAGGGWVTYTKRITNPGTVALSNVQLTDDKCVPIKYVSGDTNGDLKLDPTETWVYTCRTNLTKTTTNTAIATGEANGLTARDFAIATVVVATAAPALPNTGFAPEGANTLGNIIMLVGLLLLVSVSLVIVLRKSKI